MQVDLRRVLAIVLKDWPIDMRMRLFAWTKSMSSTACTSSKLGQEGAALNLSVNHRYLDRSCNLKLWPRIVTLSIFLVASACHPALSQNAWTGAFEGLGKAMVEIGRERAENERILELERQRAEIWARQQQNAREQELARQRQAAAAAASQKARDEQARQVEARQNGGTGSGFFVTDRGHIVTNAHVVGDYRYLLVKDSASKLFEARVVQIDKENDLALLVVDRLSKGLRISPSTTDLKGEEVFAIGYPMPGVQGQESKITNGIVSSMSGIKGVETWMQISAAIQGGNSGGPLVTPKGDVVGVVVATVNAKNILERSGSILQNVNYAIKSEYVLEFLRKASIANTAKPITGKPLRAVDDSTVMVFARDKPFSDSFVSKPSDDRVMSMEEREFADYQVVTRDASVSNIRGYLLKHPTGKYSGEAKKLFLKAEKVQWEAAKKDGSLQAVFAYLVNFPDGPFSRQAQVVKDKLESEAEKSQQKEVQRRADLQRIQPEDFDRSIKKVIPGDVFKDCVECPELVILPAGAFEMGSYGADESPIHRVEVQSIAMGLSEITQGHWVALMGNNPSVITACGAECPVENVSWEDAQVFIQKLNAKTGKNYRLPSEAEWEYACRAGTKQEYCGSDDVNSVAWYSSISGATTHIAKGLKPNAFGLYDMSGNVWEWVQDTYHDSYNGAPSDGTAWESGNASLRVFRGGSWGRIATYARASNRGRGAISTRGNLVGFRVVRTLQ